MLDKETTSHEYCKCTIKEIDSNEAFERKQEHDADLEKRDNVAKNLRDNVKVKRDGKWYDPRTGKEVKEYGDCTKYVKQALNDGAKIKLDGIESAKNYGSSLEDNGFKNISSGKGKLRETYSPQTGDVTVFQDSPKTSEHGHIQMFDGDQWVSDFKQGETARNKIEDKTGFFPSNGYKESKFDIYRNPKWNEWQS